jgi:oligopeptidase A
MTVNPILDPSFKIRWASVTPELVEPAVDEAIASAEAALAAIEGLSEALTFENTFRALDGATERLNRAWALVSHLQAMCDTPALREAHNRALPKVSVFYARIPLRQALWAKLKAYAATPEASQLPPVRARFVALTVDEFRDAGADLPPERRARVEAIQAELSQLTQKFSENVLDATNAWQLIVEDEGRLAGLPAQAKAQALASAASKGIGSAEKPAWRFTLHQPSFEPLITYVADDALRAEAWRAAAAVGSSAPHDNTDLISRIVALRTERARILGRAQFADLITARRMAKSGALALEFVTDFARRCAPAFARECRELEESKARDTGQPIGRLAPWDLAYRAELLRKAQYDFDPEELRPYFPMDRVVSGLFELVRRVFGVRVVAAAPGTFEAWHPDVLYYDAFDARDRHIGSFYTDWYPRDSKCGGAHQGELIVGGMRPDGTRQPHLGFMIGNLTPPPPGGQALLSHVEVETIFHEYGHLIHFLLCESELKSMSSNTVAWDFIELPSQIMENWTWEREGLDLFARHFETGELIPEPLFQKMKAARTFRAGSFATRHMAFAEMDLLLHVRPDDYAGVSDVEEKLRAAVASKVIPTEPPLPTIIRRFTHLFGSPVGYAAAYYSYKWAEVLDADAFTRFRKDGIFNEKVGREFVDTVLSKGNTVEAGQQFRDFMGRDPDLNALLERSGLAT